MKVIAELIGGSHLYGLSTPDSDIDKRGVFINTEPGKILGLERFEVLKKQTEDTLYFELCHYLKGLKNTNTQMMEFLFAKEASFIILLDEFVYLRNNKYKLIDSKLLYKSLCGYIENEKRLANGERTGNLGSKRKKAVETYGFSPKNFCHLFRLAYCGKTFFETDHYPTNISLEDSNFGKFLLDVKINPDNYNKDQLTELTGLYYDQFVQAFNNRKNNYQFDLSFANEVCKKCYMPFLN
jgi:predicted nucleotidyltransferase